MKEALKKQEAHEILVEKIAKAKEITKKEAEKVFYTLSIDEIKKIDKMYSNEQMIKEHNEKVEKIMDDIFPTIDLEF